nr:uncharacterized mitochondrial protein AtMg00810-like [Tanacetum cinerariifolium]
MGELTFFLGLQVKQKQDGIFISQDKYVAKILKKFGFSEVKTASTPMETSKPLLKDKDGQEVDVHIYRSMIGSLMYLTSLRPDILFDVCACARHQVLPKVSYLHAVKRIFRYLKGQSKLGLWYLKDSPFKLEAYTDSDYAGSSLDRKSTTGGCQFLGCRLISWQCKKHIVVANSTTEAEYVAASSCCGQEDRMERAATTISSLEAQQDSGNINRTQSMATLNEPLLQGTGSDSGPSYGVHQVSSTRRHDIFMLTEKDYPLTDVVLLLMLSAKLQVDEDCETAKDLVMKIFMKANKSKSLRSLDTSSN